MGILRFFLFILWVTSAGCAGEEKDVPLADSGVRPAPEFLQPSPLVSNPGKRALLLTRFKTLEEFRSVVRIEYDGSTKDELKSGDGPHEVRLTHYSGDQAVTSILKSGISQSDFMKAEKGTTWDRVRLGLRCPYAVLNRRGLESIEKLGRRRPWDFGKGDAAFYDLAEAMVSHIREEDLLDMSCEDLSEKGYLNTFNHITAQAFMTAIYSERLADFVADVHELYNMPELITGQFSEKQLSDFLNGPVDNYLDMINNEWGQELGKTLKEKYGLSRKTTWTPQLLADVLNEIQDYHSWAFQIGFEPFRAGDELVIQFSGKINFVISGR